MLSKCAAQKIWEPYKPHQRLQKVFRKYHQEGNKSKQQANTSLNNQKPLFLESVCVCVCVRTHARLNNQKPLFLEDVCVCVCVCVSVLSNIRLLANPQTIGHQAPLSMGFSKQEYWSGLPCRHPGDLPNPGDEPKSLKSCIGWCILYHQNHLGSS